MVTNETKTDSSLVAHLLRRAGFGSDYSQIQEFTKKKYEEIVEDFLNPEIFPEVEDKLISRHYPSLGANKDNQATWNGRWFYRMINTKRPLQEKMALFWHHVLATGWTKSEHTPTMVNHIEMLRKNGLKNFRTILIELSKDPAMIYWLDNNENHSESINENYGREILELFSMGIGNYTEDDIKNAARSFTGWTFTQPLPLYPYGHYESKFIFKENDHDYGEKKFLEKTGPFNGEEIIDIISQQEATARFICRHLYNFFVEDEPQVPAWSITPPKNQFAIDQMVKSWLENDADIKSVMRTLLNSDWFKKSKMNRVKCPAEFIAATLKISGEYRSPDPRLDQLESTSIAMGQKLMDPPSVEGWHTGKEWIDGGTLTERVNYAIGILNDPNKPGVKFIINEIKNDKESHNPKKFVNRMLELVGFIEISENTKSLLIKLAEEDGKLSFRTKKDQEISRNRIMRMLRLIISSMEFQFS